MPPVAETEGAAGVVPEVLISGPLGDVPAAVAGVFREPGGGRGGRERPRRPPGDDLRPRRQGGPNLGLVPPRRIRPADARRVARPRRSDPCALARQAEGDRLIPKPGTSQPPCPAPGPPQVDLA